jgi:hypothetical protein
LVSAAAAEVVEIIIQPQQHKHMAVTGHFSEEEEAAVFRWDLVPTEA